MTDKLTRNVILKFSQVTFEALHNLTTFPLNILELNPRLQPHKKVFLMQDQQVYFFTYVLPSA